GCSRAQCRGRPAGPPRRSPGASTPGSASSGFPSSTSSTRWRPPPRRRREQPSARMTIEHWIGGRRVPGSSGRSGPVYDPARGIETGRVVFASGAEVDEAVRSAVSAAAEWGAAPLGRRASAFFRLRELVDQNRGRLAAAITAEHGKVLADAAGEVDRGLENIEFACGIPNL